MFFDNMRPASFALFVLVLVPISLLVSCSDANSDKSVPAEGSFIIPVYESGLYRITVDAIEEMGVTLRNRGQYVPKLSHADTVVPILRLEDAFIFYGQGPSDRYSPYRPYLLDTERSGKAMSVDSTLPDDGQVLSIVPYAQTFEQNNFYDGRAYEGFPVAPANRDPWFWDTIQVQDQVTVQFDVLREPVGAATLELDLLGVSSNSTIEPDHDLTIHVNDMRLETVLWDGSSSALRTVRVPEGLLRQGSNSLVLDNTEPGAAPIDIMRLDRFTLSYQGIPVATDGRLETRGAQGIVKMVGFDDTPFAFDISDPDAPQLLSGEKDNEGVVSVKVDSETHLLAVDPKNLLGPESMIVRGQPSLTNPDMQADLIVIAPEEYITALEPLAGHRREQGLSVQLIALERIYEEFAGAGVGPMAINAFLTHVFEKWLEPRPSYLLLVGDASYDYRNYLGQDQGPLLPAPMVPVSFSGETVSDARLADVDGDKRPDLPVGRWPVQNAGQVKELVERTIASETAELSSRAIFAADGSESRFLALNEDIGGRSGLESKQVTYLDGPTNQEISDEWAAGAWLVVYAGHGSLDRWGKEGLLDKSHVASLETNGAVPIVLQLTCLTGLFAHPTISSLSEEMLLSDKGPISLVAATSLSLSDSQRPFGEAFLKAIQDPEIARVGDAFQQAKSMLDVDSGDAQREISDTFSLFGDPTALIRRPIRE